MVYSWKGSAGTAENHSEGRAETDEIGPAYFFDRLHGLREEHLRGLSVQDDRRRADRDGSGDRKTPGYGDNGDLPGPWGGVFPGSGDRAHKGDREYGAHGGLLRRRDCPAGGKRGPYEGGRKDRPFNGGAGDGL